MKASNLRVAVTGANGFVAKNLRKFLNQQGIPVVAIARKNFQSYKNEKKIITPKYSNNDISRALKNCNALVHLIGIGNETTSSEFIPVNLSLTKKLLDISKKYKIKKIIFNSGLGVSEKSTTHYFISKFQSEQQIIQSGLDFTIFRPSYIIGKDDLLTKNLKRQIKKGSVIIPGSGKYLIQPISVNDVVKIITLALLSPRFSKKIFDLVGPRPISFERFVKLFLKDTKTKIQKQNLEKSYYNAIHNCKTPYSTDELNILIGSFVANPRIIEKQINFKLETLKEMLDSGSLS